MNILRKSVLVGALMIGGLGLGTSSAQAQVRGGTAPAPAPAVRFYYGPGYDGYGGSYASVPTAPTYRGGSYSAAPRRSIGGASTGRSVRDYTGRHDGLARPWLRPLQ